MVTLDDYKVVNLYCYISKCVNPFFHDIPTKWVVLVEFASFIGISAQHSESIPTTALGITFV